MRTKQFLMASCAMIAGAVVATSASAQGTGTPTQGTAPSAADNSQPGASPASEQSGSTIEDVIVTANKRSENIQSVAASVTAVSQDNLIRQGVKEISDINKIVPEVTIATGNFSNVTIRGVRTGAFGPTTDSPNAIHVDGAFVSRFTSLQGLFFDVQRVEVLAGPQGTLYGRNSAGGTINVITNKPEHTFGGYATLEYGNYDAITANTAVNFPISDTLAVRAAYFHNSRKGYANNGTDDANQDSVRLSALWEPTGNDTLLLTADREIVRGKGAAGNVITEVLKQPTILTNPTTGAVSLVPSGTANGVVVPIRVGSDARDTRNTLGNQENNDQNTRSGGYMGQYDHDFGWANLTAQASYRYTRTANTTGTIAGFTQDPRLITAAVLRPTAPGGFVSGKARWDSQEIRLTSPSKQQFTYVLGLYRFHEKSYDNSNGGFRVVYPNTSAATVGQIVLQLPLVVNQDIRNELGTTNAYAAFGQGTFTPAGLDALHITGGIRYNTEKKRGIGSAIQNTVLNRASVFDLRRRDSQITYKANVAYDLTPENLIYFDHSTGFKSGGFAYGSTPSYDPEKIKAYEIGTKNRFFGNTLQINASAWHYDYTNIVTTINEFFFDDTLGRPSNVINTANGRKAKIDGQSVSVDLRFTPNDIFSLNATHINARFTDYDIIARQTFALANGLAPGATPAFFNYSGTPIGNVAKWAGNATYDHIFPFANGELDAQAAVRYTGKRLFGNQAARANVNNYIVGDPFATVDFSLRYRPNEGAWSITAYVRNMFDIDAELLQGYTSNANFYATSDPRVLFAYRTATYQAPRTYGLIASLDF